MKLKLVLQMMVPVWGRVVLAIVGSTVLVHAVGLGDLSGYAIIPGVFMALAAPGGDLSARVATVAAATVLIAAMSVIGAVVSDSTIAVAVGLTAIGFVMGVLPRVGPRAAAMQLPLLVGFAYSAGQPLGDASAFARGGAILAALPVYVLAIAVLFQTDSRRPLKLGAAAALDGVARALDQIVSGAPDAAGPAELGLVRFRTATARLKDTALPVGGSLESRADRLLTLSVQRAVGAVELVAADGGREAGRLAAVARELAGALGGPGPLPSAPVTTAMPAGEPGSTALLAEALSDAVHAAAVIRGESRELPEGRLGVLPGAAARLRGCLTPDDPVFRRAARLAVASGLAGLVAELSDLGRVYWAVFAVVVVLNAPAASDWRRALLRIAGTAAGFALVIPLIELVGRNSTAAFVIALAVLLPALVAMPVNYGAGVLGVTTAVGLLFTAGGTKADFIDYRLGDNLIGVGVVCLVGLTLYRTRGDDWWLSARLAARSLAGAFASDAPERYQAELVTRALQLRTETAEVAAMTTTTERFAPAWTFVAAAEDLAWMVVGPERRQIEDRPLLAGGLEAIAARCRPDPGPPAAAAGAARGAGLAGVEVGRMATAVERLHGNR